jgi:endonuclease/exonuclease/phosphatase family metal-dependent hydrolase
MRLIVATYNTHGGVGIDRRFDPQRIADVIGELNADAIALQELEFHAHANMLEILRERSGFHALAQRTFARAHGAFGNGLLSRFPIVASTLIDLSLPGREPRGAIDATIDFNGTPLRIVATHLGLRVGERAEQAKRLVAAIGHSAHPTLLAGDINEWLMPRRALRALHAHFGESPARATFPAPAPMLALDRIWTFPASMIRRVYVHRSRLARRASDHLPLVAELELAAG